MVGRRAEGSVVGCRMGCLLKNRESRKGRVRGKEIEEGNRSEDARTKMAVVQTEVNWRKGAYKRGHRGRSSVAPGLTVCSLIVQPREKNHIPARVRRSRLKQRVMDRGPRGTGKLQ